MLTPGRTAAQFVDNYLMKHEFVKRLHRRFAEEGITIPYPQRTVHLPSHLSASRVEAPRGTPTTAPSEP